MNQEIYHLTWNTFLTHLDCTFRDLVTERHFADVTLVSDDQVQIKAHKIILSSCSPVLKKLLLDNPHPHPMIYLSGVKHEQLESILQWMYFGETNVYKDNIEEFIEIGKDLEVKELIKVAMDSQDLVNIFTENVAKSFNDNQTRSEPSTIDEFPNKNMEYEDTDDGNVITNTCNDCETVFITNTSLLDHYRSKHEGDKYSCDECDHQASTQSNLRLHQESKHEGVVYSCNQCNLNMKLV